MVIAFIVGLISGVVSGMGIGGGTILIPVLTIAFALTQQEAQSINLLYFVPTALVALATHKKEGNIEKNVLKPLIMFGIIGAVCGSLIAIKLESDLLKKIFGGFLLIMGVYEFRKKEEKTEKERGKMKSDDFEVVRECFNKAGIEKKIEIYVNSEDLTQAQYRELLKMFPANEIPRLEAALSEA